MSKMVIVVRKDLNMRKGKIAAQVAHAALGVVLDRMRGGVPHEDYEPEGDVYEMTLTVSKGTPMDDWIRGCFKKVCVYVNSEEELLELMKKADEEGCPSCMIVDSGFTEFHGVPTRTCLAIGPDTEERINLITGHLPLL